MTESFMRDQRGRPLRDLRISVTDRCNFRCTYCMPKEVFAAGYPFLQRTEVLSFEEIERIARVFVTLGVQKFRLTGGEPLVRRDLPVLIEMLAAIEGVVDIGLTTNGALLSARRAKQLVDAGLQRLTVSLDALDDHTFKQINDVGFPVSKVLDAIGHAVDVGLTPVKVNMVVKRGINDNDILPMVRHFRQFGEAVILRFIEFMDVGDTNGWRLDDVVSAAEIAERISAEFSIEPADANYQGEVAKRWRFTDGSGELGIISSVSEPFCSSCTRARLSAAGQLFTCLFASEGFDLRNELRKPQGISDDDLRNLLGARWARRADRYSELRTDLTGVSLKKVEMSYIGG